MTDRPHACPPAGAFCGLCEWNRRATGAAPPARKPLPARGKCLHLGTRTEFRSGCGGRLCKHTCEAGEPFAVPGTVCQRCPKWEPDA